MKSIGNIMNSIARYKLPVFIIAAFIIGFLLRGGSKETRDYPVQIDIAEEAAVQVWTCSMHPQIRLSKPGKCPICGMELIPVTSDTPGNETSPRELTLSSHAAKLAEIEVAPVERKFVQKEIRMVGKVEYDETRLSYITAWLPGRIDRLYVDYTGITVRKGDHLLYIYSPELFTTQEELTQALKVAVDLEQSKLSITKEITLQTIEAAREKLRLLGMTQKQIEEFERQGKPSDHVTIYSPVEGVVIHKNVVEGMYVNTGTKIYTIADLSQVWVMLDVYESDIEWIRYGQEVEFSSEPYPGEIFKGKIAFIDPILNDKTRTVKVRVNIPNPEGRLKPGMFVRAIVYSQVATGGKVMDPSLAGKYICPMHPEIVKGGPDVCSICGMDLVKSESLGYANPGIAEPPLVIPASAPLITGKRAVVYISVPGGEGTYEGREVILGPRAGDYYHIKEGLNEGELVVVNGNFKIDSAVQILAKPSMMSPEGGIAPAGHQHHGVSPAQETNRDDTGSSETMVEHKQNPENSEMMQKSSETKAEKEQMPTYDAPHKFRAQLDSVFAAYYRVHNTLSHDSLEGAAKGSAQVLAALEKVDMMLLKGQAHMAWMDELNIIKKNGETIVKAKTIDNARKAFIPLSASLISVVKKIGTSGALGMYRFNCPMANDNIGADWLQITAEIANPFFGSAMFKCGELVETLSEGTE